MCEGETFPFPPIKFTIIYGCHGKHICGILNKMAVLKGEFADLHIHTKFVINIIEMVEVNDAKSFIKEARSAKCLHKFNCSYYNTNK